MSDGINITGINEAKAKLKELDNNVQKNIIRKGMRAGFKLCLNEAKALAPKVSGLLAKNIKLRASGTRKGVTRMSVGVSSKDFTGQAWYGAAVLYGHRIGKRALGDKRKMIPANNFLLRAYDNTKAAVIELIGDTWMFLIEGAMK